MTTQITQADPLMIAWKNFHAVRDAYNADIAQHRARGHLCGGPECESPSEYREPLREAERAVIAAGGDFEHIPGYLTVDAFDALPSILVD